MDELIIFLDSSELPRLIKTEPQSHATIPNGKMHRIAPRQMGADFRNVGHNSHCTARRKNVFDTDLSKNKKQILFDRNKKGFTQKVQNTLMITQNYAWHIHICNSVLPSNFPFNSQQLRNWSYKGYTPTFCHTVNTRYD